MTRITRNPGRREDERVPRLGIDTTIHIIIASGSFIARRAGRTSSLPYGVIPNHRLLVSDVGMQHHADAVARSKGKQRLWDNRMPRDQLQTIPLGHHGHDELRLL